MENDENIKKWINWFNLIELEYSNCNNIIDKLVKQKNGLFENIERQDE